MNNSGFFKYENKLLMILFFGMGIVFFNRQSITFLFPFITADFNLTGLQIGLLGAATALSWAIAGPLLAFIADKGNSRKKMLTILIIIISVVSFSQGFAVGFVSLLIIRLLIGLFEGPFLPIAQSMMAIESTPKRRGFNMGFMQVTPTGLFGGVVAPLVLVALANAFDWRVAFYITIIPGLILAFVMWKYMREPATDDTLQEPEQAQAQTKGTDIKIKDVIKNRNIWVSMVICSFALTWFHVFAVFAPTYLVDIKGMTTSNMSFIMSTAGAAAMFWGFVVPAISDRFGRKPIMTLFSFIAVISPLFVLYFETSFLLLGILIFLTHTGQGIHPLFMAAIPAESVPPKYIGFSVGLIMGVGEVFGGVLAPIVAGFLADTVSSAAPLWICIISALATTIFSTLIKETAPAKSIGKEEKKIQVAK